MAVVAAWSETYAMSTRIRIIYILVRESLYECICKTHLDPPVVHLQLADVHCSVHECDRKVE